MTAYQKAELSGRIQYYLKRAEDAIDHYEFAKFDEFVAIAIKLRQQYGDESDSTG
ncbi:MAG: hypothetical protein WC315_00730 [Candidatus Omnitrophota bacterium]